MKLPVKVYCGNCLWVKFLSPEELNKVDLSSCPKCGSQKLKAVSFNKNSSSNNDTAKELAKFVKMLLNEDKNRL